MVDRANTLSTSLNLTADSVLINYKIDSDFEGDIEVTFPFHLTAEHTWLCPLLGLCVTLFIGQLCLARKIILNFPYPHDVVADLTDVIRNLYDVRAYREHLDLLDFPEIVGAYDQVLSPRNYSKTKIATLLWSGGVDSTLSALLLWKNGYKVHGLHADINMDALVSESRAVADLAQSIGLDVLRFKVLFPQFSEISRAYSNVFRQFPYENSVPHGRELILFPIGLIMSIFNESSFVVFGHEHEASTKQVEYQGKVLLRCDTQSHMAIEIFDRITKKYVAPSFSVFSAVSGYTDFHKFLVMSRFWPEILAKTSSCFWGNYCGECPKCLGYYLYQRAIGMEILSFNENPIITRNEILMKYLTDSPDPSLFTVRDFHYSLCEIIRKKDIRKGEEILLQSYERDIFPKFGRDLPLIFSSLTSIQNDPLIPDDFAFAQI